MVMRDMYIVQPIWMTLFMPMSSNKSNANCNCRVDAVVIER